MATWKEFETSAPDLARAARSRFEATKHHVLATLRKDGSPRVSGTEVAFLRTELTIGSMPGSVKSRDLLRDARFALHANPGDGSMTGGDSKLSGDAILSPGIAADSTQPGADYFRLDILEVVHTDVQGDELVIRVWRPGEEVREIRRK
jgi:hypothetical protein